MTQDLYLQTLAKYKVLRRYCRLLGEFRFDDVSADAAFSNQVKLALLVENSREFLAANLRFNNKLSDELKLEIHSVLEMSQDGLSPAS